MIVALFSEVRHGLDHLFLRGSLSRFAVFVPVRILCQSEEYCLARLRHLFRQIVIKVGRE